MLFCSSLSIFFFFNDTATTEIYTLSLHDALPIALADGSGSSAALAELLNAAASLAQNQGDYATAFESLESALELWRQLRARDGEARTLTSMGWLAWRQCRYADARRLSVEGFALHQALADERGAAQALN